jgi:hypothetical protein
MRSLLKNKSADLQSVRIALPDVLTQDLADTDFVEHEGLVTFKGGFKAGGEAKKDPTGVECLLNKLQMDEFVPRRSTSLLTLTRIGISYALAVKEKLERTRIPGEFRIVVSAGRSLTRAIPFTCTFRFHRLRKRNPWLKDDIESYKNEAILTIDWSNTD